MTSGQSNLTKRPRRRRTWTVQSYSPGDANVHPHLIHASLNPPESICSQTTSRSVQPFLHSSRQRVPSIPYNGSLLLHQNCSFAWGTWTPVYTCSIGRTQVYNQDCISISSAVFAGLTIVTDRQTSGQTDRRTDHATPPVTIGRIYVRSTAMRPNKMNITSLIFRCF